MDHSKTESWFGVALAALITLVGSYLLGRSAMQVFDFFDMSAFLDAGYRVFSGQRPYVDFFYTTGPVHLYMHAFFFALFGFNKTAVLAHLLTVNAAVVLITFFLARRSLPLGIALGLTIFSAICFYGPAAHPWYDQNAFFWLILGIFLVELLPPGKGGPVELTVPLLCGLLVGISFLTKSNIGLAGGLPFFLLFALQRRRFQLLGLYVAGGIFSLLLIMGSLASPSAFLFQTLFAFDFSSRLLNTNRLWFVLNYLPYVQFLILLTIICAVGGRDFLQQQKNRVALLAGLLATSLFGAFSGSMLPTASISLVGIQLVYLFSLVRFLPRGPFREVEARTGRVLSMVLVCLSLYWGVYSLQTAHRRTVWNWRGSNAVNDYVLQSESFRGWRVNSELGQGVDESVRYIRESVPPEESLFVFPDATVVYGMTGRESFPNAPFIFHLGKMPPPGPLYAKFLSSFRASPPDWILLHNQTEVDFFETSSLLRWLQLDDFISKNYQQEKQWGTFHLLRRAGPQS